MPSIIGEVLNMGKDKPPRALYARDTSHELFFISFYVAAVYNASNILFKSPTNQGLLYFVGILISLIPPWLEKMCYRSCSVYGDSVWHRVVEVAMLVVLATAVVHIQPADVLSNPSENVDIFVFCLSLVLLTLLSSIRYVLFFGGTEVQPNVNKASATIYVQGRCFSSLFYLAATVFAGRNFYGETNEEGQHIFSNLPIQFCLFGSISWWCYLFLCMIFNRPASSPNETTAPLNVDSYLDCVGEWNMVVLGGSVLAISIQEIIYERDSYLTFYSAILIFILLQLLHFRTQPYNDDRHALRRNVYYGIVWSILYQVYSGALLVVGASCRLMLYELTVDEVKGDQRFLIGGNQQERWLVGNRVLELSQGERQQRAADMFCFAMATVWLCLDCMILVNNGYENSLKRCMVKKKNVYRWRERTFVLILLRLSMIVFIATFSQYETTPANVALVGLVIAGLQLACRSLFDLYFPDHFDSSERVAHNRAGVDAGDLVHDEHKCEETSVVSDVEKAVGKVSFDLEEGLSSEMFTASNSMTLSLDSTALPYGEAILKEVKNFTLEDFNDIYCRPYGKDSELYVMSTDDEGTQVNHNDESCYSKGTAASTETLDQEGEVIQEVQDEEQLRLDKLPKETEEKNPENVGEPISIAASSERIIATSEQSSTPEEGCDLEDRSKLKNASQPNLNGKLNKNIIWKRKRLALSARDEEIEVLSISDDEVATEELWRF